jgi:hypothetical protein
LGRRLYGKYLSKETKQLKNRINEIKEHKFDKEFTRLMEMKKDQLKKEYYARDSE